MHDAILQDEKLHSCQHLLLQTEMNMEQNWGQEF